MKTFKDCVGLLTISPKNAGVFITVHNYSNQPITIGSAMIGFELNPMSVYRIDVREDFAFGILLPKKIEKRKPRKRKK